MVLGIFEVYPHLFMLAGIAKDICRVKYWASGGVVIAIASGRWVLKIASLRRSEDEGSISIMCLILYILFLHLYAVNEKDMTARERITYLWI